MPKRTTDYLPHRLHLTWPSEEGGDKNHTILSKWLEECETVLVEVAHPMQLIRPDHHLKIADEIKDALPAGAVIRSVMYLPTRDMKTKLMVYYMNR